MTSRIDRLESATLIERRPHPSDRRDTLVVLTSGELTLIDDLIGRRVENQRRVLAGFEIADQCRLVKFVAGLVEDDETTDAGLPSPPRVAR